MYITAEKFHYSGVLAVVSGGLFLSYQSHSILSHLSRIQGTNVWLTIGFVLNGIIFMLIGLELPIIVQQLGRASLGSAIKYSLIISGVLILTRLLCALGASLWTRIASNFIKTADSNPGWREPLILGWAGMRGVVSLASALSIPLLMHNGIPFPQRNLILFITFVVILITLVFQGLTLPWVIRWVDAKEKDYPVSAEDQDRGVREKLAKSSLNLLSTKYKDEVDKNELLQSIKLRLESDIKFLDNLTTHDQSEKAEKELVASYKQIFSEIIDEQRKLLRERNKEAEVDEEVIRRHLAQLDLEEERLRQLFGRVEE
jgi:CPA1 family monovalent cation:H+ antiporter